MEDMDSKLNAMLNDPAAMARIIQMAQQLSGGSGGHGLAADHAEFRVGLQRRAAVDTEFGHHSTPFGSRFLSSRINCSAHGSFPHPPMGMRHTEPSL